MNKLRLLALACMIAQLVSGCQTAAPETPQNLDAPLPSEINTRQPAAPATGTPQPTTKPAPTVTPNEMPAARGAGVELALSRQAMEGANTFASEIAGVKEEIYFSGGYGGGSDLICRTSEDSLPPLVGFNYGYGYASQIVDICIIGFPEGEPVEIELYTPDGTLAGVKQFTELGAAMNFTIGEYNRYFGVIRYIDPAQMQALRNPNLKLPTALPTATPDPSLQIWKDVDIRHLYLWMPAGLPQGNWRLVASSGEVTREIVFSALSDQGVESLISVLNSLVIDPFADRSEIEYKTGDSVYVVGSDFPSNIQIRVGIYYVTGVTKLNMGDLYAKVFGTVVETDQQGDFLFAYQIEPGAADGFYVVIPDIETGFSNQPIDGNVRFVINTGNGTATPPANLSPQADTSFCPGAPITRLQVGDIASISLVPPDPNTVREKAGRKEKRLGLLQPGERIEILDGPKCADGWIWWKVISLESGLDGWTAEGDHNNYWLVPEN